MTATTLIDTLPAAWYREPEMFQKERRHIFARHWTRLVCLPPRIRSDGQSRLLRFKNFILHLQPHPESYDALPRCPIFGGSDTVSYNTYHST